MTIYRVECAVALKGSAWRAVQNNAIPLTSHQRDRHVLEGDVDVVWSAFQHCDAEEIGDREMEDVLSMDSSVYMRERFRSARSRYESSSPILGAGG